MEGNNKSLTVYKKTFALAMDVFEITKNVNQKSSNWATFANCQLHFYQLYSHLKKILMICQPVFRKELKMLTALLCLLLAATAAFSQEENNNVTYNDTIVKLGQQHMAVNLLKTDSRYVVYEVRDTPGERQQIERKNVQRIIHKTGRVEEFNKPLMQMVEGKEWQTIVLTEDPEDVEGLYLLEEIRMRSGSRARSPRAARIDARIRLQKTAVNKGADIMLIISSEARGGYGEMPYYVITAEAYSFMPPEAKLQQ